MGSVVFNTALNKALTGSVDFSSDSFKVLLTSGYTPDKDVDSFRSDVTGEVAGAGYSAGGASVTVSVNNDIINDRQDIALGDATWSSSTISADGAVYYKSRGGASSADEIIAFIDFGGTVASNNGTFSLGASTLRIQN